MTATLLCVCLNSSTRFRFYPLSLDQSYCWRRMSGGSQEDKVGMGWALGQPAEPRQVDLPVVLSLLTYSILIGILLLLVYHHNCLLDSVCEATYFQRPHSNRAQSLSRLQLEGVVLMIRHISLSFIKVHLHVTQNTYASPQNNEKLAHLNFKKLDVSCVQWQKAIVTVWALKAPSACVSLFLQIPLLPCFSRTDMAHCCCVGYIVHFNRVPMSHRLLYKQYHCTVISYT